jgi:hypothetical protein
MDRTRAKPEATSKPCPKVRRAIVNLLSAVDRQIAAADETKKARKVLEKLAVAKHSMREEGRTPRETQES